MRLLAKIADAFHAKPRPVPGNVPGRNEPCWCGSGQKYKRCHLDADLRKEQARAKTNCGTT